MRITPHGADKRGLTRNSHGSLCSQQSRI